MSRRNWSGSITPVLMMRRPSQHAHTGALQEIKHADRPVSLVTRLVTEWEGYRDLLKSFGFHVFELPQIDGVGAANADAHFTRDAYFVLPSGRVIIGNFAPQSSNRQCEANWYESALQSGMFEQFGVPSDATRLVLGSKDTIELGDLELFETHGKQKVAVLGRSARSNASGIELVKTFIEHEGIKVVVVPVRKKVPGVGQQFGMHWTTHGQALGRDRVALNYDYFSPGTRKALRKAGLDVLKLPAVDVEPWSGGFFVAPQPGSNGKRMLAFSEARHERTNEWLDDRGLTVIEVPFAAHYYENEGSTDCTVNPHYAAA